MDYRLKLLGKAGDVETIIHFQSDNDDEAIELAGRHADGRSMELWSINGPIMRKTAQAREG